MGELDTDKIKIFVPADYFEPAEWVLKWIFNEILRLEVIFAAHADDCIDIRFQEKVLSISCDFFRLNKPCWLQPGSLVIESREDWMDVDQTLAADLTAKSVPILWGHPGFLHTPQGDGQLRLDRRAERRANDAGFADRRVHHARLAELRQQAGGDTEHAAHRADILADEKDGWVARHLLAQGFVDRFAVAQGSHRRDCTRCLRRK